MAGQLVQSRELVEPTEPVQPAAPPEPPAEPGRAAGGRGRRRRRRRPVPRPTAQRRAALRQTVPRALVVAALAGGTAAFVAHDKEVSLDVDGTPRTLLTFAGSVGGLLDGAGLALGEHDEVAPGPRAPLHDGDRVSVRTARPLALALDGEPPRRVWTTAATVEEALHRLGVRTQGAYLSAARGTPIRDTRGAGMPLEVRTERALTLVADGRERLLRTNAATIGDALAEAGLRLGAEDRASMPLGRYPGDGDIVSVLRISATEEVRERTLPFAVERLPDPDRYEGSEAVEQPGRNGLERTVYQVRTINGVAQPPRELRTETVREPRAQVVRVGTRPRPVSAQATARATGSLNWPALARCESGGRVDAVDPSGTYGGLYQFDPPTWRSVGGEGLPQHAGAEEQTRRAQLLYAARGASPWPICGRKLHE